MTLDEYSRIYWKFYERYGYHPTRIWVDMDIYRDIWEQCLSFNELTLMPTSDKWSLILYNTPVSPR